MPDRLSPSNLRGRSFVNIGRKNYLGQSMLQRVSHCQGVPQVIVHNSRPC